MLRRCSPLLPDFSGLMPFASHGNEIRRLGGFCRMGKGVPGDSAATRGLLNRVSAAYNSLGKMEKERVAQRIHPPTPSVCPTARKTLPGSLCVFFCLFLGFSFWFCFFCCCFKYQGSSGGYKYPAGLSGVGFEFTPKGSTSSDTMGAGGTDTSTDPET